MTAAKLFTIVAWDVVLPLTILFSPPISRSMRDVGEISWIFIVPAFTSLARGAAAMARLRATGFDRPSVFRQLALGLALVILMFDEMASRLATAFNGLPPIYHWMPWLFYFVYLFLMWLALSRTPPLVRMA